MIDPGQIIYFHGIPGSPRELELAGDFPNLLEVWSPDRISMLTSLDFAGQVEQLADDILKRFPRRPLHLIGFSIGSFVALHVARQLGEVVTALDLISAAGPIEDDDVLTKMAGGPIFRLARDNRAFFSGVTTAQSILGQLSRDQLYRAIFSSAQGADEPLRNDRAFRSLLLQILRESYAGGAHCYRREVCTYVEPWSRILYDVHAPVTMWQGSEDNWTPPEMARRLAEQLPNVRKLEVLEGLSHYSTLRHALRQIGRANSGV